MKRITGVVLASSYEQKQATSALNRSERRAQRRGVPRTAVAQKRHAAPSTHEIQRVLALFQIKNYQEAETAARSLSRQYPLDGFGWKALSAILFEQARWQEAVVIGEQ